MPRTTIPLLGIERNTSNINAKEGSCEEIINMRYKDNAWRPVNLKSVKYGPITGGLDYEKIYRHGVLNDNQFIGYDSVENKIYKSTLSGSSNTETEILDLESEVFLNFSHLGNILIVGTETNKHYLRYDTDSGDYLNTGDVPQPLIEILADSTVNKSTSAGTDFDDAKILCNLIINNNKSLGYFNGLLFIRFAYKLFDGNYIEYSQVYNSWDLSIIEYDSGTTIFSNIRGTKFAFNYLFSEAQKDILQAYDGLIQSFCVFFSNPHDINNIDTDLTDYTNNGGGSYDSAYNDITNAFQNTSNFYLVHEIPLEDILNTPESTSNIAISPNFNTITTLEVLPINDFTNHKYIGNYNYMYNSRVHLCNVTTIFSKSYRLFRYNSFTTVITEYPFIIEAYLKTDDGEKIVRHEIGHILYSTSFGGFWIEGIICYPDTRAFKIKLIEDTSDSVANSYNLIAQYDLEPHPVLNLAYYSNETAYLDTYYPGTIFINYPDSIPSVYTLATEDNTLQETNRMQVSELDNPFYYPSLKSYRISTPDNEIIGVSSIAEPISEGQFGQFPLYAFTTNGIYSIEQGSGPILYASIVPVNREVCNNANSIVSFNGGIFFSTDNGLFIISGRQIQEISQPIEGDPDSSVETNPFFQQHTNQSNLVELYDNLSSIDFLTFLETAILAYDYTNSEIIISNPSITSAESSFSYEYSYVYNVQYGTWHKITQSFSQFIPNYPESLAYSDIDDTIYNITQEADDDYISCLIQTRPFKLGPVSNKKLGL